MLRGSVQVSQHVPQIKAVAEIGDLPPGFSVPNIEEVGGCNDASSLKSCGSLTHVSQEKTTVNMQGVSSSGEAREASITSSSSSRSQQTSNSNTSSSSMTAQYYSPSLVQVSLRHATVRVSTNFYCKNNEFLLTC
jgi:hypothetical protein